MWYRYGYGWGYRGWGPWYRRRPRGLRTLDPAGPVDSAWGWAGIALWIILLIAIIWAIGAWRWGTW